MSNRTRKTTSAARAGCAALVLATSLLCLLNAGEAHASGFLFTLFGSEHGHPTTDDPSAIYFNPAGIALRPGRLRIIVEGDLVLRGLSYQRPDGSIDPTGASGSGTPPDGVSANSGRANLFNVLVSPFIAITTDFGVPNLGFAVGFYAPFGGQASWSQNQAYAGSSKYPGAVDGVQRWAVIDGTIQSLYTTAAISYYIPKARLSIGAGVNFIINEISLLRARNADGTDNLVNAAGDPAEGRSFVDVKNYTASVSAGLIFKPTDNSWIGASYQSQPGFGENTLTGTLKNRLGTLPVGPAQPVEMTQSLPDVVRVGARWRPRPAWELRLSGEFARWSVFDKQCVLDATVANRSCKVNADGSQNTAGGGNGILLNIPRQWKDAWGIHAGASYFVKPEVELFLGAGYDSSAVPDKTLEASLPDMDKVLLTVGTRLQFVKRKLALRLSYTQIIFVDRTVPTGQLTLMPPSRSPDAGGTYTQSVGVFAVSLEYLFL